MIWCNEYVVILYELKTLYFVKCQSRYSFERTKEKNAVYNVAFGGNVDVIDELLKSYLLLDVGVLDNDDR